MFGYRDGKEGEVSLPGGRTNIPGLYYGGTDVAPVGGTIGGCLIAAVISTAATDIWNLIKFAKRAFFE